MTLVDTRALRVIAETEFSDIVTDVLLPGPNEMRIFPSFVRQRMPRPPRTP